MRRRGGSGLLYREDIDEVRRRLTDWWNGGDIGRPAMQITAPRPEPLEDIPAVPEPEGSCPRYTAKSLEYRVNRSARACASTCFLAEAVPAVSPDLGAGCLALYLGSTGVESDQTVWFEPAFSSPEEASFEYDPENFYWDFTLGLAREQHRIAEGKFLLEFPDLIEGLDTLAALRGTEELLVDLLERPEWVEDSLRRITDLYFRHYDILYDVVRDELGGSVFWAWAPGRMAKFQCDISAMISPEMFGRFMVPLLREMTERVSYCMYHWDGPGATAHLDHLLSIPRLPMIQWTPGAGAEAVHDLRWWPLYHRIVDAGKKVFLMDCGGEQGLARLKEEFGPKLKQFLIRASADSPAEAQGLIELVSD